MRRAALAVVATITVVVAIAQAHIAPSVDDNNRYLKVTPGADRIRLAYTVFFGEKPGALTRKTIDANRDGTISDEEAQTFAVRIAGEVGPSLEITVDGATRPVSWSTVAVGMGSPSASAGAFSIDLVAWLCLPSARGKHTVLLRDRFRIPRPGETEVKVEDGPGITIDRARIGPANDPSRDFKFVGPGGPLADDGLDLAFTATDKAPLTADGTCNASTPASGRSRTWIAGLVIAALVLGAGALIARRRMVGSRRA